MNALGFTNFLSGLSGLVSDATANWLAPIFLIIVAAVAITFLIKREIRGLIIFIVIAIIVGVLIFAGDTLFGANGTLTNAGKGLAQQINTILPISPLLN